MKFASSSSSSTTTTSTIDPNSTTTTTTTTTKKKKKNSINSINTVLSTKLHLQDKIDALAPLTFTKHGIISFMSKFKYDPESQHPAYIIVHDKVYDIKDLVPHHPGGSVILTHLGRDGSDAFDAFHSDETAGVLANYYVGDIIEDSTSSSSSLFKNNINIYLEDNRHQVQSKKEEEFVDRIRSLKKIFEHQGLYEASPWFYLKTALLNLALFSISIFILFQNPSHPVHVILSAAIMGLFWQQCGWLSHDFLHHQVFNNRSYNDLLGFFTGGVCQGFGVSWWKDKHNTHHAQPNIHSEDPDIDTMPILAWSEHALEFFADVSDDTLANFFVGHQAWLYFPILAIARTSWLIQSVLFVTPIWKTVAKPQITFLERLSLGLHYTWYFGILATLSPAMAVLYFCVSQMTSGLLLAFVFSLNHNGMPVFTPEEATYMDFYRKQIVTGRDVNSGMFLDWFMGGLNYQIEHHLFPSMPRHSLAKVKPVIQKLCSEFDVHHHDTSFWEGTMELLKRLEHVSKLSRKARKMA